LCFRPKSRWRFKCPGKKSRLSAHWFIHGQHPVALKSASLFLPVIEIGAMVGSACAAELFGIFGGRLAVIFENHPDISQVTGRRVGS
jgi:hypothetical protein